MQKYKNFRILIFDDHQEILDLLAAVFNSRGYEVLTYPHPGACPIFNNEDCSCAEGQSCTDIILTDINMPVMKGLDFIEKQLDKGRQCRHLALMSGDYTPDDRKRANDLGLKFFQKPFDIADVFKWLDQIEENINPQRQLTDYKELLFN
jgi:CheY-like chemotaxis protein